jgi:hypothetical protein
MKAVFGMKRAIYFFFGGTVASLAVLAARNFTIFLAGTLVASSVAELRRRRALLPTRTKRPRPGSANTPVFWECSAISERTMASRFETPSRLAVSKTEGNDVVIFAGRAMTLLLWQVRGSRSGCGSAKFRAQIDACGFEFSSALKLAESLSELGDARRS